MSFLDPYLHNARQALKTRTSFLMLVYFVQVYVCSLISQCCIFSFKSTLILSQCSCSTLSNFEASSSDVLSQPTISDSEIGEESLDTSQMAISESDEGQHAESEAEAILSPRSVENSNYIPSSYSPLLMYRSSQSCTFLTKYSVNFFLISTASLDPLLGRPRRGIKVGTSSVPNSGPPGGAGVVSRCNMLCNRVVAKTIFLTVCGRMFIFGVVYPPASC